MKLFVFDDHPWMARKVESHLRDIDNSFQVFALSEAFCREPHGMDDFFNGACEGRNWYEVNSVGNGGMSSLRELGEQAPDQAVFLINVSLKSSISSYLQDQDGVEVLKHIRLSEELGELRMAHVVLYSVERPGALLWRKSGNLMMVSKGATLLYLPNDMKRLLDLNWLKLPKADLSSYYFSPFVACDYRQPDSAHRYSNWWGMKQFIEARRSLAKDQDIPMPAKVTEELRKLENKKASFLNQVGLARADYKLPEMAITPPPKREFKVVYLDDEPGWQEIVKNALEQQFQKKIQVEIPLLYPKNEKSDADQEKSSKPEIEFLLPSGDINQTWLEENLSLGNSGKEPNLVMIDLRMRGGAEANTPVEQTSGAQVARVIRKLNPGLPIILMTASNKAWTYEAVMKLGIDGYWMKEGIGEHLPPGSSIENYNKLMRLVRAALGDDYQHLRTFSNSVVELSKTKDNKFWWCSHKWRNYHMKVSKEDSQKVFSKIKGIQLLYHEFLRNTLMGSYLSSEGCNEQLIGEILFLGIFAEIRSTIELIHGGWEGSYERLLDDRGDLRGKSIWKSSCDVLHKNITKERSDLSRELDTYIRYLSDRST